MYALVQVNDSVIQLQGLRRQIELVYVHNGRRNVARQFFQVEVILRPISQHCATYQGSCTCHGNANLLCLLNQIITILSAAHGGQEKTDFEFFSSRSSPSLAEFSIRLNMNTIIETIAVGLVFLLGKLKLGRDSINTKLGSGQKVFNRPYRPEP